MNGDLVILELPLASRVDEPALKMNQTQYLISRTSLRGKNDRSSKEKRQFETPDIDKEGSATLELYRGMNDLLICLYLYSHKVIQKDCLTGGSWGCRHQSRLHKLDHPGRCTLSCSIRCAYIK